MNAGNIVNMVIRMVMRRLLRQGVNAGMDAVGRQISKRRGGEEVEDGPAPDTRQAQQRMRQTAKMTRKMGRF